MARRGAGGCQRPLCLPAFLLPPWERRKAKKKRKARSHNHAVQGVKEEDQVEAQLDERLLLVLAQGAENLGRVKHVVAVDDSA